MAHSAVQEALSYGVSHDVFHRWMRAVMDKTVQALAAVPAQEHATQLAGQGQDAEQHAFDYWMARERPSGDAESVHRQWEESGDYADLCAAPIQAQEDAHDLEWLTKEGRAHGFRVGQIIEGAVITHSTESLRAAIIAARAAQGGAA